MMPSDAEKITPNDGRLPFRAPAPRSARVLTVLVFTYILIFASAWGDSRQAAPAAPGSSAAVSADDVPAAAPPVDESVPVPVPEPSPVAREYYRTGNGFWLLNRAWGIVIPALFVFSGFSTRLRMLAVRLGRGWFLTIGFYMIMFLAVMYAIDFPLSYYQGYVRQHAYGLSNQTFARWLRNSVVRLGVDMAVAFAIAWIPYLLIARSPRRWWIYMALLSVPFLFATMLVMPLVYDPLFNTFGPMKNKELERSILTLAGRAGIAGSRVFEVDKSADTNAVNAYVTGFWQSKRIVLWDTLIKKLDERELLVVMGHEMGHYVLGHVVRSILMSSIITLLGLFLVDRAGRWLVSRYHQQFGFASLADVASVPLLVMLLEVVFLILSPAALAFSRYQEHEADRYSLDLTRANHSAATAHVKLQAENLSNPRPGWLYKVFRSTHPSAGERIDFANSYHPWRASEAPGPIEAAPRSAPAQH